MPLTFFGTSTKIGERSLVTLTLEASHGPTLMRDLMDKIRKLNESSEPKKKFQPYPTRKGSSAHEWAEHIISVMRWTALKYGSEPTFKGPLSDLGSRGLKVAQKLEEKGIIVSKKAIMV